MTPPETTRSFTLREAPWEADRAALSTVRHTVFVLEQKVPAELEWDAQDPLCLHVLALDSAGRAMGCGRLLPDGHIGRMAVLQGWRNQGVGQALLQFLLEKAKERGHSQVQLNAQVSAVPFYAKAGFAAVGPRFMEAGIVHQAMELTLD